ncbi:MAG: T9SS type A sorting domain-containing protein [Bacteroidetes bacterium]|nr:T9SS type A sorting domain-containing protein [Bacteroidota bacterium]
MKKIIIILFIALSTGSVNSQWVRDSIPTTDWLYNIYYAGNSTISLSQNFPYSFNPVTKIRYALPRPTNMRLTVIGREIETLVNENQKVGTFEATFDASPLSSGVYYYRLTAEGYSETRKMVVTK